MKEILLKLGVGAVLLTGCAGEAKDTSVIPTPPDRTDTPTPAPEDTIIPPDLTPLFGTLTAGAARLTLEYDMEGEPIRRPTNTPTSSAQGKKSSDK